MFRFRLPDRVICVSRVIEDQLPNHYHFLPEKVITVANGIDTDRFTPSFTHRLETRRRWGIAENALVFGAVARLERVKGLDVALASFKRLVSEQVSVEAWLVLVGDGAERESLWKVAEELGVADRVRIMGFSERTWESIRPLTSS